MILRTWRQVEDGDWIRVYGGPDYDMNGVFEVGRVGDGSVTIVLRNGGAAVPNAFVIGFVATENEVAECLKRRE